MSTCQKYIWRKIGGGGEGVKTSICTYRRAISPFKVVFTCHVMESNEEISPSHGGTHCDGIKDNGMPLLHKFYRLHYQHSNKK